MARKAPSASTGEKPNFVATPKSTLTFQKQYQRGSGYPIDPSSSSSHHGGHHHPPPPPPHSQHYTPSQSPHHYASGHHAPPPPPPPGHHGYAHPPASWYYPPNHGAKLGGVAPPPPPSLVTPKSHDSGELLPPLPVGDAANNRAKKSPPKLTNARKSTGSKRGGKKESINKSLSKNAELPHMEEEEELKVDPMKQDFHFYAMDNFDDVKRACQRQLDKSHADGSIPQTNKNKELYLINTFLNARLIQNWEAAPPSTRAEYLRKEEADRKRFMSEEEVASRHCATLTARRRSPKQSSGVGSAGSFGLSETVAVPPLPLPQLAGPKSDGGGSMKRPGGNMDTYAAESAAKRVRAV